jgi:hypothetical protein
MFVLSSQCPPTFPEGRLAPWKLDANGNASRPIPNLVGFDCGFGSCGDLLQGEVMARRLIAPLDGRCGGASWALPGRSGRGQMSGMQLGTYKGAKQALSDVPIEIGVL